jgi:hypothetical protein
MKTLKYLLVTTATIALNATAFAANVVPIEGPLVIPMDGSLMVNSGNGFQQLAGPAQVAPGGSVMVSPGGKGEIVYTDGCRVPVRSGALAQVEPLSPCAQGADFGVAPAGYGGYATPCCGDSNWLGYTALGIVGVAGIVAAAWGGNHHDNQNGPVIVLSNKIDPITVTGTNTNTSTNTNSATGGNATASNANANTAVAIAAQAQNQDQAQQQQQQQQQCQGQVGTVHNNTGNGSNTAICAVSP